MHKPLSKKEREGLRGFIGRAIIRMSRGSEREFETLYSKLEALHLDVVPDLDLVAYAIVAGWKSVMISNSWSACLLDCTA
jgi:hypothetical protein